MKIHLQILICLLLLLTPACAAKTPVITPTLAPSSTPDLPSPTATLTAIPDTPTPTPTARKSTRTPRRPTATFTQTPTNTPQSTPLALENTPVPLSQSPIDIQNAAQVVELTRWGKGRANQIAYSPDGNYQAVASSLGVFVYSKDAKLLSTYETPYPVYSVAFSPDGTILAYGTVGGKIEFLNWRDGIVEKTIISDNPYHVLVTGLGFSPRGDVIASIETEDAYIGIIGWFKLWRVEDGELLYSNAYGRPDAFQFVLGEDVFYYGSGYALNKISIEDGTILDDWSFTDDGIEVGPFAVSPDESVIALAGYDTVALWKPEETAPYLTIEFEVNYSQINYYLAPACDIAVDGGFLSVISLLHFSDDGKYLIVEVADGATYIHRVSDGAKIDSFNAERFLPGYGYKQVPAHPYRFGAVAISPDSRFVAAGSSDQLLRVWSSVTGQRAIDFEVQAASVTFSPDGKYLIAGSSDWTIKLIGLEKDASIVTKTGHVDTVTSLAFSPDGKTLFTGSKDCTLKMWRFEEEEVVYQEDVKSSYPRGFPFIKEVTVSHDGNWLAIVGDWESEIISLAPGQKESFLSEIFAVGSRPRSMAFSPDSQFLVIAAYERTIVWDIANQKEVQSWDVPGSQIAYSPDGSLLAIGNDDGSIRILNAADGTILATLSSHRDRINDLAFAPDGTFLVSASADGTVRLWGIPQ